MEQEYAVRKATVGDVKAIHALLMQAALKAQLLPRALAYLYGHVRNFMVLETDGRIVACTALAPVWEDLAEVCSLVVDESCRGRGFGRVMVEACIADAPSIGIRKVFALTYQEAFFHHMGFRTVEKDVLPQKIWADCVHCPKYPDCDEFAVLYDKEI